MPEDARTPRPHAVLPLRGTVLLPGATLRIDVGRPRSVALLRGLEPGDELAIAVQRRAEQADPTPADLFPVGVAARVVEVRRSTGGVFRLTVEGGERLTFLDDPAPAGGAGLLVLGHRAEESRAAGAEAAELAKTLLDELRAQEGADVTALEGLSPSRLADHVATALGLELDAAAAILTELDVPTRLAKVLSLWTEARSRADVRKTIDRDVRAQLHRSQREAILREQLRAIQKELGDRDDEPPIAEAEWKRLRAKLDAGTLPDEVAKVVERELGRLRSLGGSGGGGAEANVIRSYLEWIASLPFTERAEARTDIDAIARELDLDHEGLGDVKKRILEHMAVQKLAGNNKGTLLCLAGPPGVGKTSLGESIARATGRPFRRISLGGVRDEAEIRGHRRTYVGALPGRILHALRKVGVKNPVLLLDEIDKLSVGYAGNPEAALLEVLDPEQNHTFTDHYLELPFDLSEVLFLCTANDLDRISPPLRDRLEVIELSGYTRAEKLAIARSHLVPKRASTHGIAPGALTLTDDALLHIIDDHTREAGVRQLGREITRICRSVALDVVSGSVASGSVASGSAGAGGAVLTEGPTAAEPIVIDAPRVEKILGKPRYQSEIAERTSLPGVATGLAWTPTGGDILFIETSRMPGKGRVDITGQLGDVMSESARAALTYLRSHATELTAGAPFSGAPFSGAPFSGAPFSGAPFSGAAPSGEGLRGEIGDLTSQDVHIHVPQGAVPKDGPSAGVTIFTALVSLFSGRRVRSDTAMTGECTLRGRVLPVGGIKAKVLAAHRAGLKRVILPARNRRDVADIPDDVASALEIVFADDMRDVLAAALEPRDAGGRDDAGRDASGRDVGDQRGTIGRLAGSGPISPSSTSF